MIIHTVLGVAAPLSYGLLWRVCRNIINNNIFVLLLYRTEATGFSLTIMWSVPPNTENISHQQLTLVLCVEFHHL